MAQRRRAWLLAVLLPVCSVVLSCATTTATLPTLTLEEHSLRMPLTLAADGTVLLAESPPLVGRIDLTPILKVEGVRPAPRAKTTVQVMIHYGRLYVVADSFRAIWEITPQPGTTSASYRPIAVVDDPQQASLKNVRLSRYGAGRTSCLRLDRSPGAPIFITSTGEARDDCQ